MTQFRKPGKFDRNLIVIGGGSAGLVAAYTAAVARARVTLIERDRLGGDCLYTGCVPSKALIRSARLLSQSRRPRDFGFRRMDVEFDFAEVMDRVHRVIRRIEPHDAAERYTALGVECIQGEARITTPWSVDVNGRTLTARGIIIATGARPVVPPIPGMEDLGYLNSETVWGLRELPRRLLVIGGGSVGCELAQCFTRLGSAVTLVEALPRVLSVEDPDISRLLAARLHDEGMTLLTGHTVKSFRRDGTDKIAVCESAGRSVELGFDEVLVAVGRRARTEGYGLQELEIALTRAGTVQVNRFLQTRHPSIFACGDVAGPFQFTHLAAHQAWYAAVNALLGGLWRFAVDYSVIPWATFTDPEVARVGLNETQALERRIPCEVTTYGLDELDRAIMDEAACGQVKVLTVPGRDRILGASIIGAHAAEWIAEFITAMRHGLGLNRIRGTIHIYPTLAEANKYTAGNWRRAHAPEGLLRWLGRYHAWRRG